MNDNQYFFCIVFVTSNLCRRGSCFVARMFIARIFVDTVLFLQEGALERPRVGCPSIMMLAGLALKDRR